MRIVVLVVVLLGTLTVSATEVVPLTMNETIRQSDAIVLGTVTARTCRWGDATKRWIVSDYTFAVEEVLNVPAHGAPLGKTITLTYWGGTIDGETQGISDVRLPAAGERLILMLKDSWREPGFTPVVGLNQGLFVVVGDGSVTDFSGQALGRNERNDVVRPGVAAPGKSELSLAVFKSWLRANIAAIKAAPTELRPPGDRNDPRVMKTRAGVPEVSGSAVPPFDGAPRTPVIARPSEEGGGVPVPPPSITSRIVSQAARDLTSSKHLGITPHYSTSHQAYWPITMNQFPTSFAPWSPEDQYQMSKWNYYTDVFRVYATPTGTYGWPNGRFDLDGWPSSSDMQSIYGAPWDAYTIGVTYYRWDSGGWIVEADIALNPAFSFTLDDEWVYDGGYAQGFRQVMVHELGHVTGLEHQFNYLSVMNYMPSEFRFFAFPYTDDAGGVRFEYSGHAVGLTDLAVYLYYASGYQSVSDASYPTSVNAGSSFNVNYYHVENVGTTTISTPTVQWYLTAARNFNSSYYYLGTTTYSSLAPFTYFTPSTVTRTLNVPASVPPGYYYLSAYIPNDAGAPGGAFPYSNNYGFSRLPLYVYCPSTTITASNNGPVCSGGSVQLTATTVSGASYAWTGPNGYYSTAQNPSLSSVSASAAGSYSVTVSVGSCTVGSSSTTVSISALGIPQSVSATASSTTTVGVSWSAASCAASYDIYRSASGSNFVKIGSSGTTAYSDTTAAASTAYLYAVKAVDASANSSSLSARDLATTVIFTDPTLTSASTTIKAIHVAQLRTAVNAVRALAALGVFSYTDGTITSGTTQPKAVHITDLRTALGAARTALALSSITFTDPTLTANVTSVKAAHVNELRNGVK